MTWKIGTMVEVTPERNNLLVVLPADQGQNLRAYFLYKLGLYLGQHYTDETLCFNFCNKNSNNFSNSSMEAIWGDELGYRPTPSHNNVHMADAGRGRTSERHMMDWLQRTARQITDFVLERMPPPTEEEQPTPEEPAVEEESPVPVVPEGVGDIHWETEPELPDDVWVNDAIHRE